MRAIQNDLFAAFPPGSAAAGSNAASADGVFPGPDSPDEATVAAVRARVHATLALVQAAEVMPWAKQMTIIHEDNGFRFAMQYLPPEEAKVLWAAFDVEMDRLYAIMNAGKEMGPEP